MMPEPANQWDAVRDALLLHRVREVFADLIIPKLTAWSDEVGGFHEVSDVDQLPRIKVGVVREGLQFGVEVYTDYGSENETDLVVTCYPPYLYSHQHLTLSDTLQETKDTVETWMFEVISASTRIFDKQFGSTVTNPPSPTPEANGESPETPHDKGP